MSVLPAPGTPVIKQIAFRCSLRQWSIIWLSTFEVFSISPPLFVISATLCFSYRAIAASMIVGVGSYPLLAQVQSLCGDRPDAWTNRSSIFWMTTPNWRVFVKRGSYTLSVEDLSSIEQWLSGASGTTTIGTRICYLHGSFLNLVHSPTPDFVHFDWMSALQSYTLG